MPICVTCGEQLETAEYLDTEEGFASAEICMNENCYSYILTNKLYYNAITFYLVATTDNRRIYESLDELTIKTIITAPADYDGALIGEIDECFREDQEDDMIRYFDSQTGIEEV